MKYKVVFLLRYWAVYGGGETVTIALANEMVRRGLDVSVIYLWDNSRSNMPFIDERIKAVRVNGKEAENLKIDSPLLPVCLHDYIEKEHVDFVINQWWLAEQAYQGVKGTSAILIKCHHISVQGSWNIKVHDAESLVKYLMGPLYRRISKKMQIKAIDKFYNMSDYVSFLAPAYVDEYKSLTSMPIESDRVLAIFNPQVFAANLPKDKFKDKENVALFVGRMLNGQKGIFRLMRVWQMIEQSGRCNDWKLEMVGAGDDLQATKELAKKLGLKNISFEGFQQPDKYYERAKVFLMSSKTEGLPMTLIEAKQNMLCPIVMDTFTSLHDVLVDGKDGIIVKEDEHEMAKAFIEIAHDPIRLEKMATDNSVISRFDVVCIVDQWMDLFKRATKKI